jgi:hypothetical protein
MDSNPGNKLTAYILIGGCSCVVRSSAMANEYLPKEDTVKLFSVSDHVSRVSPPGINDSIMAASN